MHVQFVMLGEIFNPTMAVVSRTYDDMSPRCPELFCLYPVPLHSYNLIGRSAVDNSATGNATVIMHAFWIWIPYIFTDSVYNIHEHISITGISYNIAGFLIGDRLFDLPDNFYSAVSNEFIVKFHSMNIFYRRLFPS